MSDTNPAPPIVAAIMAVARSNEPDKFAAFFCGGVIANVVGNLPEDYWVEFRKSVLPCGQPGCDCHKMREKLMPFLEIVRADHQAAVAKWRAGS